MKPVLVKDMVIGNHYFDCSFPEYAFEFKLVEVTPNTLILEAMNTSRCKKFYSIERENGVFIFSYQPQTTWWEAESKPEPVGYGTEYFNGIY